MKSLLIIFTGFLINGLLPKDALTSVEGKPAKLSGLQKNKATVFIFLSPECPLCQSYSLTLNNLNKQYSNKGVQMIGVIPGQDFSEAEVNTYKRKYKISFPIYYDRQLRLTKYFNANITPQAFVVDKNEKLRYNGRIDNWAYELGKKRSVITEHDLKDALSALILNKPIQINQTKAIGCFIE
jgi:peroxiredoxin